MSIKSTGLGDNMKFEIIKAVIFMSIGMGVMYFIQTGQNPTEKIEKVVDLPEQDQAKKLFENISNQMQKMVKNGKFDPNSKQAKDISAMFDKSIKVLQQAYTKAPPLIQSVGDKQIIYTMKSHFVDMNSLQFKVTNNILKVSGFTESVDETQTGERTVREEFEIQEVLHEKIVNKNFSIEKDDTTAEVKIIFSL